MKRLFILLLCCTLYGLGFGQGALRISSPESKTFFVDLDGERYLKKAVTDVTLAPLTSATISLEITWTEDNSSLSWREVPVQMGQLAHYELSWDTKGYYTLRQKEVLPWTASTDGYSEGTDGVVTTTRDEGNYVAGLQACCDPMSGQTFSQVFRNMIRMQKEGERLDYGRRVIQTSCLDSEQLAALTEQLRRPANRLELARFAYEFVVDPENYQMVIDLMEGENDVLELSRFIQDNYREGCYPLDQRPAFAMVDEVVEEQAAFETEEQAVFEMEEQPAFAPEEDVAYKEIGFQEDPLRPCRGPLSSKLFRETLEFMSRLPGSEHIRFTQRWVHEDCLTSAQIKAILPVFQRREVALSFAKYAFNFVYDPEHYEVVIEAFPTWKNRKKD
ncbi:MAG: DUF4476 domain-containing protein [Bacteroidota bacterium]